MPSAPPPPVSRYLWAQGAVASPLPAGTVLASRYEVLQYPLVRDQHPDEPPLPLDEVPPLAEPYLALSRFLTAVPRPFTQVLAPDHQTPLLLLEEIPLQAAAITVSTPPLLPALLDSWKQATALQQLTWLWRLAKLWQPCCDNHVATSLLDWQNLRVDGEDVRLVELLVRDTQSSLADLGKHWQSLTAIAAPPIREYLVQLVDLLASGKGSAAGLIDSLVQAIVELSSRQSVSVQLATCSDQGPTRQRNEDACYPESGFAGQAEVQAATADAAAAPLVVVCDGVGGHQGGDVASHLAIAEVTQRLGPITATANVPHRDVVAALKQAIRAANQSIADRNDAAQRQDRDRMGTTIVIALVYGARLYIAHLGDSRAYRVRSHTFRQLTLDDDVAAREMRLGLELYQDALQNPGSGALVQALGMADSSHLHPTVKLYPIATDSLVVLCTDGLSDDNLIERLWPTEFKPVLTGESNVATASQRLVDLANTHNGHDNVTVALLRLLPQPSTPASPLSVETANLLLKAPPATKAPPMTTTAAAPEAGGRSLASSQDTAPRKLRPLPLVVSSVLIAGLVGTLGAIGWQWFSQRSELTAPAPEVEEGGETLSPTATPPSSAPGANGTALAVGDYLQISQLPDPSAAAILLDAETPPASEPPAATDIPERLLAVGSIVQVMGRRKTPDDQLWIRLEVCSVSTAEAAGVNSAPQASSSVGDDGAVGEGRDRAVPLAQPGDQGWLLETNLPIFAEPLLDTTDIQPGACSN